MIWVIQRIFGAAKSKFFPPTQFESFRKKVLFLTRLFEILLKELSEKVSINSQFFSFSKYTIIIIIKDCHSVKWEILCNFLGRIRCRWKKLKITKLFQKNWKSLIYKNSNFSVIMKDIKQVSDQSYLLRWDT